MSLISKIKSRYVISANNKKALDSYLETMLWSSTDKVDGEDVHLDSVDAELSDELIAQAKKDIEDFYKKAEAKGVDLSKYTDRMIGHDFWLTRNGHGAGFWDGDYDDEDGELLTEISKEFKELDPYIGDDGEIYT